MVRERWPGNYVAHRSWAMRDRLHAHVTPSPCARCDGPASSKSDTGYTLVQTTGLTPPTVNVALADLERLGIVAEVTGRRRGRVYAYGAYLDILGEGMTPLPV